MCLCGMVRENLTFMVLRFTWQLTLSGEQMKEKSTCERSIFTDQQLYREIQLILLSKNINHSVLSIKVVNWTATDTASITAATASPMNSMFCVLTFIGRMSSEASPSRCASSAQRSAGSVKQISDIQKKLSNNLTWLNQLPCAVGIGVVKFKGLCKVTSRAPLSL